MKKNLFLTALFAGIFSVNAQETTSTSDVRQNDIMVSPIELIAVPALNISYERLLNESAGLGINGLFYFDNNDDDHTMSQISPYYRMYFGKKYASGFFVEGFVPITVSTDTIYEYNYGPGYSYTSPKEETISTVGIGIGFGGKWVARKNIVFEASTGIARRFGIDPDSDVSNITGKGMLGIGYRF